MRVGFMDPEGPLAGRLVPYVAPLVMLGLACSGLFEANIAVGVAAMAVAVFNLIGLWSPLQVRRGSRAAELTLGPGYVDVRGAGSRTQRIHAKDITGATTARTRGHQPAGLLLTLQHAKRAQPLTLELASEADAEKVRRALGIGHGGFGTIGWRTASDSTSTAALVGRLLAFAVAMIVGAIGVFGSAESAFSAAVLLSQLGVVGSLLGLMGLFSRGPQPSVLMAPDGLRVRTATGWFSVPYGAVGRVENTRQRLVFHVPPPYFQVAVERASVLSGGATDQEHDVIVAQIRAASLRARGLGPVKDEVAGRLDVLRRNGETIRDWLVRLDMAGQVLGAGSGYRGNMLSPEDLWAILEDPEAEQELRAAAARVLRHHRAPEVRVRIDAAVAAVRDPFANERLRIAVDEDDPNNASYEIALVDAKDARRAAMTIPQPHRVHGPPGGPTYGR